MYNDEGKPLFTAFFFDSTCRPLYSLTGREFTNCWNLRIKLFNKYKVVFYLLIGCQLPYALLGVGLLEIVRVDLELIDNCISDLLEFPLQSDITSWELGWEDLNKHGEFRINARRLTTYIQTADDLWNSAYIGNNKTL